MKKFPFFYKTVSILLSFILLAEFNGCYSLRPITMSETGVSDKYLIHCVTSIIPAENMIAGDSLITFNPYLGKDNYSDNGKVHLYLYSDTLVKVSGNIITVPVKGIARIERNIPDVRKTKTLTAVLIITGVVGVGAGLTALLLYSATKRAVNEAEATCDELGTCFYGTY
ncbi:MAG: hypothetical protein MUE74_02970 [Bacteroidales bacterium]|nr:hypothetical protein [Bacteroidales bacterium]